MTHDQWLQAQYSVLGSVLIEPRLVPKLIQQTRRTDFTGECSTVYDAIVRLFMENTPVDPVTLRYALGSQYGDFLKQLMEITPTAANFDYYVKLCREQAKILSIRSIAEQLKTAEDNDTVRKLMDKANEMMVDKTSLRIATMDAQFKKFFERHVGDMHYLAWPIGELNNAIFAEPGDFIILGGYPSTGKSAFSLQCALQWSKEMKVGFFSLETRPEKLFDRMMSSMTMIDMVDLKKNRISESQWNEITNMAPQITSHQLEMIPAAGMTVADIKSVSIMRGYKLIVVDYLQLVSSTGSSRTEEVSKISMAFHQMAQSTEITVVGLSQLSRGGDDDKHVPKSSDLRESGQLEQDGDVILILKLKAQNDPDGPRDLYIVKNKEHELGKVTLAFDGKHQTFSKAVRTGETFRELKRLAKEAHRNREAAPQVEQFTMLPEDTDVPF